MEQQNQFEVIFLEDASKFLMNLQELPRKKIYYNITKVAGGIRDSELFKKLDGNSDFWEFRTLYNGVQYRMLAFWDAKAKRIVVATHGFVKKTWKVPAKEIDKAEALRKEYYESK